MIYYNEFDKRNVAMLEQMMADGLIPKGDIDDRSIEDIKPGELSGYTQCHFFAGIGGWPIALELVEWDQDRPVWTGSCPCQPYSVAGRQKGKDDPRHLWPVWERLIGEYSPATIFGEQVENAITKGWLDDVSDGLENKGYAFGSAVLPACSVGAPHRRNRIIFVATKTGDVGNAKINTVGPQHRQCGQGGDRKRETGRSGIQPIHNSVVTRLERHARDDRQENGRQEQERSVAPSNFWDASQWLKCLDGKSRLCPTEPDFQPLAYGFQHRRWLLHAAGNAIVPQVVAEFTKAAKEVIDGE